MKASIYQRESDKKWVGSLSYGKKQDGTRNRIVKYADAEKDIESIMNTIIYEIKQGEYVEQNKDTLIAFLKEYHGICSGVNAWASVPSPRPDKAKWEETTSALFKMYIDVHFGPYFNETKLIDIKPITLDKFYNYKLITSRDYLVLKNGKPEKKARPPLSINTVIKLNKFLKAAFNYAVINEIIKKNPTVGVKLNTKEEFKPTVYGEEQFINLMDHVRGTDDEIPIVLGAGCGFRRGEIFGLRWKDINFGKSTITVEKTAVRFNKNIDKDRAKNKTSQRTITVSGHVMETLEKYRNRFDEIDPEGKIITRWKPGTYSERFGKLLTDYGMAHCRLHDLRHYNAVLMMRGGIPDKVTAERLGHSNVATLRNIYQHVFKDMDEAAADKINDTFKTKISDKEKQLSKEERKAMFKVV